MTKARFDEKIPQSGICSAPCATRGKQIFFIGGKKKFGGGGESECGMTQSNQKNEIFTK